MNYGFIRVASAVPELKVADCKFNASRIIALLKRADAEGIQFIVFPELGLTGYTCGDLFHQDIFLKACVDMLRHILNETRDTETVAAVGMPIYTSNKLYNCAVVIQKGEILGIVPKANIPGYKEFYEERWFSPGEGDIGTINIAGKDVPFGTDILFQSDADDNICFGVELCEDLWVPIPPSSYQAQAGATFILNLSASNEYIGKYLYRRDLIKQQSGRCIAGYVYTSSGMGESSTDIVFGGHAIIAENGEILTESKRFSLEEQIISTELDIQKIVNDRFKMTSYAQPQLLMDFRKVKFKLKDIDIRQRFTRNVPELPFVPEDETIRRERCREAFSIQTAGLAQRLRHTGIKHAVLGISGGLDSTLALLVTARTFDMLQRPRKDILAVTMPGFGTSGITYSNAVQLMNLLGVTYREINIREACLKHFEDIGHDPNIHDVTYENVQARERTQILMDLANKIGGLVIGTGDLSELALGWSTYNGDHMSMYAVNCGVPKTLVKHIVKWYADVSGDDNVRGILYRIIDTPISPELLPPDSEGHIEQKTEDIIGPFELHDFYLYHMVRYGASPEKIVFLAKQAFKDKYDTATIIKWLKIFYRRFFSQQFKRSCVPDGPKVGSISLSPRGDWRMPSDASAGIWLDELDRIRDNREIF